MKKYILVTGASGGIGSAISKQLASEGWNLYLHYHSNKEAIIDLLEDLSQFPIECIPIKADLSTSEGVAYLLENIFQIDALCYVSGTAYEGLFMDMEEADINKLWQLHVHAPTLVTQRLLHKFLKLTSASIVFVSSIWGQTGAANEVIYSTAKGAQNAFVKALSKEVALSNIRVNAIAPGSVDTKMMGHYSEEEIEMLYQDIPMGRFAQPEEVAHTVAFLVSEKASYITGQIIGVNGGWYT